jgi:two-component system response regulator PhoP
VSVEGAPVELTAYEFRVLEYLILNAGRVISKSRLTEHLYSEDEERDSNVIEVFIRRLRSKLDPANTLNPITTLRGAGYRWDIPRS